ncbi:MAG: LysE family translocator [Bacteroidota bacterium]
MFGITNFTAFIVAGIILNLTPGADTLYILGRSVSQGRKAGIYSALGISVGCLIHTMLAAFGLSMIIAQSQTAFAVVKYAGALYLFYLGIRMILSNPAMAAFELDTQTRQTSFQKIFLSGIITNVLNPKVALFFLAFLPQFVESGEANNPVPFLILGFTFITTGTLWCLMLAFFSSMLARKIRQNYFMKRWLDRLAGILFITLGVKLALQTRQ